MNNPFRHHRILRVTSVTTLVSFQSLTLAPAFAADLPVAINTENWKGASINEGASSATRLQIDQTAGRAALEWQSFDIGEGHTVQFVQPDSSAIALNRVTGDENVSRILGNLVANGQVYLINPNGVVFGAKSVVDVAALMASSLDMDVEGFLESGIYTAINDNKAALYVSGDTVGDVTVAEGARLNSKKGGFILLAGGNVTNSGTINTPDGQALLLASKDKIYLAISDNDSDLRGLLVEVDNNKANAAEAGVLTNIGEVIAERGNITLAGLAVNQQGRLRATTSVDVNGSIYLQAREGNLQASSSQLKGPTAQGLSGGESPSGNYALPQRGGDLRLAADSVTEVVLDNSGATAVDAQEQNRSRIILSGKSIHIGEDGATDKTQLNATSGQIDVVASAHFDDTVNDNDSEVVVHDNAQIDVSGTDVELAMERNVIDVELRSYELRNSPVQKGGVLQGSTVQVDLREGTDVGDISGALGKIERTVQERSVDAGSINVISDGSVRVKTGAEVDISGGSTHYRAGQINTTKLLKNGQLVDIGDADADVMYDGIYGDVSVNHDRWSSRPDSKNTASLGYYQEAYTDGANAGDLTIRAGRIDELAGRILAGSPISLQQRQENTPYQGGLSLNTQLTQGANQDVLIGNGPATPEGGSLYLDADRIKSSGLGSLSVKTNGDLRIADSAQLKLADGGAFFASASAIGVDGTVAIGGGHIQLTTETPFFTNEGQPFNPELHLGAGAVLDVSGTLVNDNPTTTGAGKAPVVINGGSVSLKSNGSLLLDEGSQVLANGGLRVLDQAGKYSAGKGGNISLRSLASENERIDALDRDFANGGQDQRIRTVIAGDLEAYGLSQGGGLVIEAAGIRVTSAEAASAGYDGQTHQLLLSGQQLAEGGFAKIGLTSNVGELRVEADINLQARNYVLKPGYATQASNNGRLADVATVTTLPDYLRKPVSLSLKSSVSRADANDSGLLLVEEGVKITAEPGASISLSSETSLAMQGEIHARGGDVRMELLGSSGIPNTTYRDDQVLWLGEHSLVDVSAVFVATPDANGYAKGTLHDAGSISLEADYGYVVAKAGAELDISGLDARIDTYNAKSRRMQGQIFSAAAGSLDVEAAEGFVFDAEVDSQRGSVTSAQGASIRFSLNTDERVDETGAMLSAAGGERRIIVGADPEEFPDTSGLVFGDDIGTVLGNGRAYLDAGSLTALHADNLTLSTRNVLNGSQLKSLGVIEFDSNDDQGLLLSAARKINLETTNITANGGAVIMSAPVVSLGRGGGNDILGAAQKVFSTQQGDAHLTLAADLVDVVNNVALDGLDRLDLVTAEGGEVRFTNQSGRRTEASLRTAADVHISAGQIYPSTNSRYRIEVENNSQGQISLERAGQHRALLSAAGELTLAAPVINQGGVIKSPLGIINLLASEQLNLLSGSLTSVSAQGQVIPFGVVRGTDIDWMYGNTVMTQPLEKAINLQAPSINVAEGAVLDISGGGDLFAYDYQPLVAGTDGDVDPLSAAYGDDAFAIVPGQVSGYAPVDSQITGSGRYELGQVITLSTGINGLPAGTYTVMPARYALLEGAYLVRPSSLGQLQQGQSLRQDDGAIVVAGKLGVSGTPLQDQTWTGFVVESGAVAYQRATYATAKASTFFANSEDRGRLPQDAGSLTFTVGESLDFAGELRSAHVSSAQGGLVQVLAGTRNSDGSLNARNLSVIAEGGTVGAGVSVTDTTLNALDADILVLGGSLQQQGTNSLFTVSSNQLSLGDGVNLEARELLLGARQNLDIGDDVRLSATGELNTTSKNLVLAGDSAVLRLSAAQALELVREGASAGSGSLRVGEGTVLAASQAALVSVTGNALFQGGLSVDGESLTLDARYLALGADGASPQELVVDEALLANVNVNELILSSANALQVRSGIELQGLERAVINTGGIDGHIAGGETAEVQAKEIVLQAKTGNGLDSQVPEQQSRLSLVAESVLFKEGADQATMQVSGFEQVQVSASKVLSASGDAGLAVSHDLIVDSAVVTTGQGSALGLVAGGDLHVLANQTPIDQPHLANGGRIALQGHSILHEGRIQAQGADVSLNAESGIILGDGAVIQVGGSRAKVLDKTIPIDGGDISLRSDSGDISVGAALLDISQGANQSAKAGRLDIVADAGDVRFDGTLRAEASGVMASGSVRVVGNRLTGGSSGDFGGLLDVLADSGARHAVHLQQRRGDLALSAEDTITASSIYLGADTGTLELAGTLDASGIQGGSIRLVAADDVLARTGAVLDASASTPQGVGGRVDIHAGTGEIDLQQGARIQLGGGAEGVGGGAEGVGGELYLRAGANDTGMRVLEPRAQISGVATLTLEAFSVQNITQLTQATLEQAYAGVASWFDAYAVNLEQRFTGLADKVKVLPGLELVADGDLSVNQELNLAGLRFGADEGAGVLTLRVGGNLNLQQGISDGFDTLDNINARKSQEDPLLVLMGAGNPGAESVLMDSDSWSLNLVAGADLGSADRFATRGGAGNMHLAAGQTVRTGTGDIQIATGGDISLGSNAAIYSAGKARYVEQTLYGVPVLTPDNGSIDLAFLNDYRIDDNFGYMGTLYFPEAGGDVHLLAQGQIQGEGSNQLFSDWLHRVALVEAWPVPTIDQDGQVISVEKTLTFWGVEYRAFHQGIAAFGGGNITASAGDDISNLTFSTPATGKQTGIENNEVSVIGGGDIVISAEGDLLSGKFLADKGVIAIDVGGDVGETGTADNLLIALGDAAAEVRAQGDIVIDGISNYTMLPQSRQQASVYYPEYIDDDTFSYLANYFFSYGENSGVNLHSTGGDIHFQNDSAGLLADMAYAYTSNNQNSASDNAFTFRYYPGQLTAAADSGDIVFYNSIALFPQQNGGLDLFAGRDIHSAEGALERITINVSDADAQLLPRISQAVTNLTSPARNDVNDRLSFEMLASQSNGIFADTPVHSGDATPSTLVAGGSIYTDGIDFGFMIGEATRVSAGGDIRNTSFRLQNVAASDVSVIETRGSLIYELNKDSSGRLSGGEQQFIEVLGPGRLDIIAGQDISLGVSRGIEASGNTNNPALMDTAADINILVGIGQSPAYQAFIETYLADPAGAYVDDLIAYFVSESFAGDLVASLDAAVKAKDPGHEGVVDRAQALAILAGEDSRIQFTQAEKHDIALQAFRALDVVGQRGLIADVYVREVKKGGIEDSLGLVEEVGSQGIARSMAAIETLFPTLDGQTWKGDLGLTFSRIQSLDHGSVRILAPGGSVDVGLAGNFAGLSKGASELGIILQGYGEMAAIVDGNINVNQSRIFGLGGGDLMLWSSQGDIDAGKGAKTALTVPPPSISLDDNGNAVLVFPPAITGSGIRAAVPRRVGEKGDGSLGADTILLSGLEKLPAQTLLGLLASENPAEFLNQSMSPEDRVLLGELAAVELTLQSATSLRQLASAIYGSESRTLSYQRKPSVLLLAPKGIVDAGDAGIGSDGDLLIAAQEVLGADNIDVGGVSVGIPVSTSLAAGLQGVSNASSSASGAAQGSVAEEGQEKAEEAVSNVAFVTVEVLGYGDEEEF